MSLRQSIIHRLGNKIYGPEERACAKDVERKPPFQRGPGMVTWAQGLNPMGCVSKKAVVLFNATTFRRKAKSSLFDPLLALPTPLPSCYYSSQEFFCIKMGQNGLHLAQHPLESPRRPRVVFGKLRFFFGPIFGPKMDLSP